MPSSGYTAISFTAGEQPTTAKWNLVGSNDASFNTGNGFNDAILAQRHFGTNSVPAAALDTAAITLGYAQVNSNQTFSSTTLAQVTGLTLTVTIPSGGRRVKITAYMGATYNSASNGGSAIVIYDGTIGVGTVIGLSQTVISAVNGTTSLVAMAIVTPSAGSKTYNVGMSTVNSGTVNTNAGSTNPIFLLVEMI